MRFALQKLDTDVALEKRTARLATLEGRVLTGKANAGERREYERLRSEVPETMSEEVDRVAGELASPTSR